MSDKKITFEELMRSTPETIAKRNQATFDHFLPEWLQNCRLNAPLIETLVLKHPSIKDVPHNNKDLNRFYLIGSGPSLNKVTDKEWSMVKKGFVVASPTNYSFLMAHEVEPDVIISLDSNRLQAKDLNRVIKRKDSKTSFVLNPTTSPSVFQYGYPNIYLFKAFFQNAEGNLKGTFNSFMNLLYSNIKDFLVQAGCVSNTALLFIREYAKLNGILLKGIYGLGLDYAYTDGLNRCHRYEENENGFVLSHPSEPVTHLATHIISEGVLTNIQMYLYMRSFYILYLSLDLPIYMQRNGGLMDGVFPSWDVERFYTEPALDPYPIEEVAERVVLSLNRELPTPVDPEEMRRFEEEGIPGTSKEFLEKQIEKN